jgi:hypothetical protein
LVRKRRCALRDTLERDFAQERTNGHRIVPKLLRVLASSKELGKFPCDDVDAIAAHTKQKEVGSGASQPPALPNLRVKPPTVQGEPAAAAIENGRSETLPPTSLPFGNWK